MKSFKNLLKKGKSLKILFVGPEVAPFVKIGGLGEVMYALPKALHELGHDVRTISPKYASINEKEYPMEYVIEGVEVPDTGEKQIICNVKKYKNTEEGVVNYFLENQEYYEKRGSVYGYDDDPARWAVLSRGTLEFIKNPKNDWVPDIIVANDWQGGLIPNYQKTEYAKDPIISKVACVFVIHNIHYQSIFDHKHVSEMDYDDGQSAIPAITDPRMLKINFMRRGIRFADMINTVSPTYAREITTEEYGELLEDLLRERRSHLTGILNGINYDNYNPETNPYVEYKYNSEDLEERAKNKKILQQKFNLPENKNAFVAGIVSRLSDQKGLDLVMQSIEPLVKNLDMQFVLVGTGDPKFINFFQELDKKHENVSTHLSFDGILPHIIYSGADVFLIPSKFEPCGLTQMEAMRYGCVPVVRKVGGLADSVTDHVSDKDPGDGFVFDNYDSVAFTSALVRAYTLFKYPKIWQGIQERAMNKNFSWEKSAKEYEKLFTRALSQFNS